MSEVISFRLDLNNPREAQAYEVLLAWAAKGYNIRFILTEALLNLDIKSGGPQNITEISEINTKLADLLSRIEGKLEDNLATQPDQSELSTSFLSSISALVKPGIHNLDDKLNVIVSSEI